MSALQQETLGQVPAARRKKDRRRNRRVAIRLKGRFLDQVCEDHTLTTRDISCGGALVDSKTRSPVGSSIVCYFDHLGRVSATVVRHTETGFAVQFQVSQHKRDKLADKLTWLVNRDVLNLSEERAAPRYAAAGPAIVKRADGRDLQCRVIDISLTGAGFKTTGPAPVIGEIVKAGNLMGRVVRCEEQFFAIRYLTKTEEDQR